MTTAPVQKIGAYKVVSRRGPYVAGRIAQRRLERFRRRNRLTPVTPMAVRWHENYLTGEKACVVSQRVVAP